MLSILIGLACLAVIAAFWEQLFALLLLGLGLFAGVLVLTLAFYLWAEYSEPILVLMLIGGALWTLGGVIKNWKLLLQVGRELLLLPAKLRSFLSAKMLVTFTPKRWTFDGMILAGNLWVFLSVFMLGVLPLMFAEVLHSGAFVGVSVIGVSLTGIGGAWGLLEFRRLQQFASLQAVVRSLLAFGWILLLIPGLLVWPGLGLETINAGIASGWMGLGAIMWLTGVAMFCSSDYKKPQFNKPEANDRLESASRSLSSDI